jgi:phytol kinase
MTNHFIGLAISYIYATSLLIIGEGLHRLFHVKPDLTRKVIHIGAGMWVLGVLLLFNRWEIGIIPFATFIGLNYLFYRYRIIGAMDSEDSSPGTVYFAISVTLLFGLLWRPEGPVDSAPIAVAGIMAMTWGDALAALIGKRFGQHKLPSRKFCAFLGGFGSNVCGQCSGNFFGAVVTPRFIVESPGKTF